MSQENEMPKVSESVRYKWKKQEETEWRNLDKIYTGKIEFINYDGCVISNESGCAFFDYADDVVEFITEQTQADKLRKDQIEKLMQYAKVKHPLSEDYYGITFAQAESQYSAGVRVLAPDERICSAPEHPDDEAIDRFAAAMKAKMKQKRVEGRGGWNIKSECSAELLSEMLVSHIAKGDPVDVANFAMMLHHRGEGIVGGFKICKPLSDDFIEQLTQQVGPIAIAVISEVQRELGLID